MPFDIAVSHTEWQERNLSDGTLTEPMERVKEGVFQLPDTIAAQADGFPAEALEFVRN